ncbi:hypothetical protein NC652_032149 [Populus alba x Populus x berolinensis]|nr:hypothetical protein NC652_032149 [Populus alba x Populus x berolinensis]
MGAPKQKWTAEEEAALKAGVLKHGTGKWRTILMDPDFSAVLRLRSNVDLKDKWRNINVTAIWGSRQKAKLALKRSPLTPKREENGKALSVVVQSNEEVVDAKPLAMASGTPRNVGPKDLLARLDNLILEAITTLKEPSGSDRASIALYIQEKYWAPMNLRKLLGGKLKHLTANGKLIKVKHKYMIASSSTVSEGRRNHPLPEGKQKEMLKLEKSKNKILTKAQVDQDLLKIRGMTASEAAAAAAAAVAEAETAIAEAEAAAREAEKAEAEAEAAQVFAKAAIKAFKHRACHPCTGIGVASAQHQRGRTHHPFSCLPSKHLVCPELRAINRVSSARAVEPCPDITSSVGTAVINKGHIWSDNSFIDKRILIQLKISVYHTFTRHEHMQALIACNFPTVSDGRGSVASVSIEMRTISVLNARNGVG